MIWDKFGINVTKFSILSPLRGGAVITPVAIFGCALLLMAWFGGIGVRGSQNSILAKFMFFALLNSVPTDQKR